jgi:hypothetical protein
MSKRLEHFHLARAIAWPLALPVIFAVGLQDSVFLVLCLSLYANLAGDVSAWQAARAERRSVENA